MQIGQQTMISSVLGNDCNNFDLIVSRSLSGVFKMDNFKFLHVYFDDIFCTLSRILMESNNTSRRYAKLCISWNLTEMWNLVESILIVVAIRNKY